MATESVRVDPPFVVIDGDLSQMDKRSNGTAPIARADATEEELVVIRDEALLAGAEAAVDDHEEFGRIVDQISVLAHLARTAEKLPMS